MMWVVEEDKGQPPLGKAEHDLCLLNQMVVY